MKKLYLLLKFTIVIAASGCASTSEAQKFHCRKCQCQHFAVTDTKLMHIATCIYCGHSAEAHGIARETINMKSPNSE